MTTGGRRVLVLMHGPADRPELLGLRIEQHGLAVDMVRVDKEADRMTDLPSHHDAVMVMGADESVYDDRVPWIEPELSLVRRAVASEVPVLGVCFGGQLLALALGGKVVPAATPEMAWVRLQTRDRDLIPPGPWLSWHSDVFTVPPGARCVAWSDTCPHAFTSGPHLGLQFHPEITPALLREWLDDADRRGCGLGPEGDLFLAATAEQAADSARRAATLLDQFLRRSGLAGQAPNLRAGTR